MWNLTVETGESPCPFGYTFDENTGVFYFCAAKSCRELTLNLYADGRLAESFPFPGEDRVGDVFRMGLFLPLGEKSYSYTYSADGVEFSDPYGRVLCGREVWGKRPKGVLRTALVETGKRSRETEGQEVEARKTGATPETATASKETTASRELMASREAAPEIPYEDSLIYRLHVRGFTMDRSSGLEAGKRGTFEGVMEKIPYLKELGVTTVELLPVYEFEELQAEGEAASLPPGSLSWNKTPGYLTGLAPAERVKTAGGRERGLSPGKQEKKINYWGFTPLAGRFAVKQAYGGEAGLRRLIQALHREGMELVADLYFDGSEPVGYVLDVLHAWAFRYGADGLHLIGQIPERAVLTDPYLAGKKLWMEELPEEALKAPAGIQPGAGRQAGPGRPAEKAGKTGGLEKKTLAVYNTGFQNDMRRFLKGDEGLLYTAADRLGCNPAGAARINFMANTDGFTLSDMLAYNRRHNEANGEQNQDGTEENYSWNCGEEGPSRKKAVQELRLRLWKNAVLMTLFARGTPLICAGDEMGHSKKGNNNSWCQDNRTEWLDWKDLEKHREQLAFFRYAAALRREHPVLRMPRGASYTDYLSKGLPDVSLHGESAWKLEPENGGRQLAFLCYGAYAEGGDDSFYIGYNMHWEPHDFALPALPEGTPWELLIDTSEPFTEKGPRELPDQRMIRIPPRTAVVLIGRSREEKRNKKGEGHER